MRVGTVALPTRRATLRLARALGRFASPGDLFVLEGPLGAGKTFLSRGLLREMGVPSGVPVTSPTFSIVREYDGRTAVLHIDLYRLERPDDVAALGIRERRGEGAIVVVEWGSRFIEELGAAALVVTLRLTEEGRTAEVDADASLSTRITAFADAIRALA